MDGQMAIRRARSARRAERVAEQAQGCGGSAPVRFFLSIHKQTQFTSPRTSFSPCCQPRMLLPTHATFSRPRATGNVLLNPPPARSAGARFAQSIRMQALGRMRTCCSTAHLALVTRLDDLRHLLLQTSTSSTCAAPSGPRAFFAGEPAASRSGGAPGGAPRGRYRYSAGSSRQWSVARAGRVRPARWPRWASPGRRAPSQPGCCGDTRALWALRLFYFLSQNGCSQC